MSTRRLFVLALLAGPLLVPARTLADPPLAEETTIICTTVNTAVYPGSRVHLRCSETWENPSTGATANFFAAEASASQAGQVVTIGVAAQTFNKKVRVRFRTSSADNPPGCEGNCRKLVGAQLEN
jgi:hypothetical protein